MRRPDDRPSRGSIAPPGDPCLALLRERRRRSGLECIPIPLETVQRWTLRDGSLRHDTGGFFSVIGIRGSIAAGGAETARRPYEQPLIDQPEIGILGVLLRMRGGRAEILVQAKAEPGNVDGVQLSPTVQATESNYRRLHGGAPTLYLEYFTRRGPWTVLTDSRQSEQGTRFLGKYNRNVTVLVHGVGPEPSSDCWRWCPVSSVLRALAHDFAVNTDLRSVLATSDWRALAGGGAPFGTWSGSGGWGEALLDSCLAEHGVDDDPDDLARHLEEFRQSIELTIERVPLQELDGWRLDGDRIRDLSARRFEVSGFRVHAPDREVPAWDQPLMRDLDEGEVILVAQSRNGVLRFLLRPSKEIGFREKAQYGPSWQGSSGGAQGTACVTGDALRMTVGTLLSAGRAVERLSCRLSEEGGRFYLSTTRYRVIEIAADAVLTSPPGARYATLGQIRRLLAAPGLLNNEARSAVALLLSWLQGPAPAGP